MELYRTRSLRQIILFTLLGTLMFLSKLVMEFLPNIHPVAMLLAVYTLVYRWKALIPLYVFVCLNGLAAGFNTWWVPYLYIWLLLALGLLLIPEKLPDGARVALSVAVTVLHGLLYGALYAPWQAVIAGMDFRAMLAWIAVGFPYDILHACGNLCMGLLVYPLYRALKKLNHAYFRQTRQSASDKTV